MSRFGRRLQEIRRTKQVTATSVASQLGIAPRQMSTWERSGRAPNAPRVLEICRVLDCSPAEARELQELALLTNESATFTLHDVEPAIASLVAKLHGAVQRGELTQESAGKLERSLSRECGY